MNDRIRQGRDPDWRLVWVSDQLKALLGEHDDGAPGIEVGGQLIPPSCNVPGSRLDSREYICTCPNGGQRVEVAMTRPDSRSQVALLRVLRDEGPRYDPALFLESVAWTLALYRRALG